MIKMTRFKIFWLKLILRFKYNMRPNKEGTYDLKSSPGFKDAKL